LLSVLAYDRSRGFEADADGAALVDKSTFGGDPPDDILGCQYRRHRDHLVERSRLNTLGIAARPSRSARPLLSMPA
jgi:hypothetical protein